MRNLILKIISPHPSDQTTFEAKCLAPELISYIIFRIRNGMSKQLHVMMVLRTEPQMIAGYSTCIQDKRESDMVTSSFVNSS